VLGERPDVTIIDERNILDDGYGTIDGAIRAFYAQRPVYVVPPEWQLAQIRAGWATKSIATYPGYSNLLRITRPK
jgi:hypothetical protein